MRPDEFRAFKIENLDNYKPSFSRKGVYRICFVKGQSRFYFSDKIVDADGVCLFFGNINTPYSWEIVSKEQSGYGCLFTESFLRGTEYSESIQSHSIFNAWNVPVYKLTDEKKIAEIEFVFSRIIEENSGEYVNRNGMIRSFISILLHEALKMHAATSDTKLLGGKIASERICSQFLALLGSQFPIHDKTTPIRLTTTADFAYRLGVHPNYLNRAVKKETGKTIQKIITERVITEAKILLYHADWSISEISYALGFEYVSYFDKVFKKNTGVNPNGYRKPELTESASSIGELRALI